MYIKRVLSVILTIGALLLTTGGLAQAGHRTPSPWMGRNEVSNSGGPVNDWFLISSPNTPLDGHEWYSSVAYNSYWQEYLVVWNGSTSTGTFIYGQFVGHDGALIGSRFMISPPVGRNMYPDVAYNRNRNEYLVVYMVETSTPNVYGIYGMRLNAFGVPQELEHCFAVGNPTYTYLYPAVAYSTQTDEYLVTWQRERGTAAKGIEARTMSGDGSTKGPILEITGLQVEVEPSWPDVAYTGTVNEFLVVWQRWYDYLHTDHDIMGQRIGLSGGAHLEGPAIPIHYTTSDETTPAVASVPRLSGVGEYLVACTYNMSGSFVVVGQLLTSAGALHDWVIISPQQGWYPRVASNYNTREFLVVWFSANQNIQARTVTTSGILGPYAQVPPAGDHPERLNVAGGPLGDYLVTCHDRGENPVLHDVFGFLWGNRVFLPLVLRGH